MTQGVRLVTIGTVPSPSSPLYRLYFIHLAGCDVCAELEKTVLPELKKRYPWIRFVDFDYAKHEWKADKWIPDKVPAFIVLKPNKKYAHIVGGKGMTPEDVEAWLKRVAPAALWRQ